MSRTTKNITITIDDAIIFARLLYETLDNKKLQKAGKCSSFESMKLIKKLVNKLSNSKRTVA